MRRDNDRTKDAYLLGVFTDEERAIEEAHKESKYRGGKYWGVVKEVKMDSCDSDRLSNIKIILECYR